LKSILPYLCFNTGLEEAVELYTQLFPNSTIKNKISFPNLSSPDSKILSISFQLWGQDFLALSGGPTFSFTPAISFFVSCNTPQEVDKYWTTLSKDGEILMDLGQYPFNQRYGWCNDRFGLSWQISLTKNSQRITPFVMFIGENYGKAQEAIDFYTHIFPKSNIVNPDDKRFTLYDLEFRIFENNFPHTFHLTPAISFYVSCDTQEEIDQYWYQLSEHGEQQMCGWLKDKYGISWQIIPSNFEHYVLDNDEKRRKRVFDKILSMKKIEMNTLIRAFEQNDS
jgi:predicted 3-demethylubiquinone-9 3-methyltransferase (glyoxalase superfamily)